MALSQGRNYYAADWISEETLFVNSLAEDQWKFEFNDLVCILAFSIC
jgi:hypothetical protein